MLIYILFTLFSLIQDTEITSLFTVGKLQKQTPIVTMNPISMWVFAGTF